MIRIALIVLVLAAAAYLLLLLLAWRFQERITFQPPKTFGGEPEGVERVDYRAPDGTALYAYVVGEPADDVPVLLVFHGNADLARWLVPWAGEVHRRLGAAVVLAEYRGYGGLAGSPTYVAGREDSRAALTFVRDRWRVPPGRLVYFGHSLGSAIATELAAEAPPRSLVLESPFTSARAMANRVSIRGVSMAWSLVARVHYDTELRVRSMATPVWVSHGDRDLVIPIAMGRAVFGAARRKGELLVVQGAGHNDVQEVGGDAYWHWLGRAIEGVPPE